jgi:hypothetical protein
MTSPAGPMPPALRYALVADALFTVRHRGPDGRGICRKYVALARAAGFRGSLRRAALALHNLTSAKRARLETGFTAARAPRNGVECPLSTPHLSTHNCP